MELTPRYEESLSFTVLSVLITGALLFGVQLASHRFSTGRSLVVIPICSRCQATRRFATLFRRISVWGFVIGYPLAAYFRVAGYAALALMFNGVWSLSILAGGLLLFVPRPLLRADRAGRGHVDLEVRRQEYARLLKDANPAILGTARV